MKKMLILSLFMLSACVARETRHGGVDIEPGVVVEEPGPGPHRPPPYHGDDRWDHNDPRCRDRHDDHCDWH